jgi:hypothetical protein
MGRTSSYAYGWNVSAEGYADTVMGMYNHSTSSSAYSIISGRNNFNASYNSFINGTFNNVPYTYLGHKTVFGNGNVVNGSVGLTSGVALLNKSFGTTVIGQANADYTNTEQGVNIETAPLLLLVTECKRSVWEMVCIHQKQRVGTIEKWFDDFAKCN